MNLDKAYVVAVLGDKNSGKTNLMFYLASKYRGSKTKYLYGYPKVIEGFRPLNTLYELANVTDGVILMDELQNHIAFYQTRMNETFLKLLSAIAHNGNTLIFTTPMSQFITKTLDCFIDGFCYTKIKDLHTLKNGSKAKRNLQNFSHPRLNEWCLGIKVGDYLEIVDSNKIGENGLKKFTDMGIKKDWRPEPETEVGVE